MHHAAMDSTTAEIFRRLENIIRHGTIAEVDHAAKRVRVQTGELLTGWLPWKVDRAGTTRTWNPPTVGEQVTILSPGGDLAAGVAMTALYSDEHDSPSTSANKHKTEYPDGAVIEYDHESHTLNAILPSGSAATVKANTVTSDAPETICTGNLTVQGNLEIIGHSRARGTIECDEDVIASDVSLLNHIHPESIGSETGAPT